MVFVLVLWAVHINFWYYDASVLKMEIPRFGVYFRFEFDIVGFVFWFSEFGFNFGLSFFHKEEEN